MGAQVAAFLAIIALVTSVFGTVFFSTARRHLETEIGAKLQDIARIAARNAPAERIDLIAPGDAQTRLVLRLKEKLAEIREASGVGNIFVLTTDRKSVLDLDPAVAIGAGYELPHLPPAFLDELDRGSAVSTQSYRAASGALYMTAFAPISDATGRLRGIVGVDAGAREIAVLDEMRARLWGIALLGVIPAVLMAWLLANRLTRPVRDMAAIVERIGRGEYDARVSPAGAAELARLADAFNAMADGVQRRDAQLREITAGVAHEIRNPLNSIKLLVTLLGEELAEAGRDSGDVIPKLHREIAKLNRFLTEFLTHSRPLTLRRDDARPGDLARDAAAMAMGEAQQRNVSIEVRAERNLPVLLVDRERMEQSLLNIVLNAVQASPPGGHVEVTVRTSDIDDAVELVVDDDGAGLDEGTMSRLFQPFFTTKSEGTGLGLSNARKVVAGHGGAISATNRDGGGARFVVRLPMTTRDEEG